MRGSTYDFPVPTNMEEYLKSLYGYLGADARFNATSQLYQQAGTSNATTSSSSCDAGEGKRESERRQGGGVSLYYLQLMQMQISQAVSSFSYR